jgi:hypothetical protein
MQLRVSTLIPVGVLALQARAFMGMMSSKSTLVTKETALPGKNFSMVSVLFNLTITLML